MLSDGIVLSIAINRQCRKSAKIADCLARHSGTALRMARLGSLFSLSEEFVDNASLASIPSAPQKHEVAQLASSGQEGALNHCQPAEIRDRSGHDMPDLRHRYSTL